MVVGREDIAGFHGTNERVSMRHRSKIAYRVDFTKSGICNISF